MECTTEGCDKPVKNKKRGLCSRCYQYWLQTDAPHKERCPVEGCSRPQWAKGLCNIHYRTGGKPIEPRGETPGRGSPGQSRGLRNLEGRYVTSYGYVKVRVFVDGKATWALEHRHVMEQKLGRNLLPGENVHHLDGNKENNHPNNLELWVSRQPAGQRPDDLVDWALEILRRYKPDALHV